MIDGIVGLASSHHKPKNSMKPVNLMANLINKKQDLLNFRQKIDVLYGLTSLDPSQFQKSTINLIRNLVTDINKLQFHIIGNDLFYSEMSQLNECYVNLKVSQNEEIRSMTELFNKELKNACDNNEQSMGMYMENSAAKYDPLKPRVM